MSSNHSSNNSLAIFRSLDRSSSTFFQDLDNALHERGFVEAATGLRDDELKQLVDQLDEDLNSFTSPQREITRKCLRVLSAICGRMEVLPKSYLHTLREAEEIRMDSTILLLETPEMKTRFFSQAVMWKRLSHKSLTPALNFDLTFCREDPCPHIIIYPHTVSEGLGEYIGKNPPLADRVKLLSDIAKGLQYLHLNDVIHGCLSESNIVVDSDGNPQILNFGLMEFKRSSQEHIVLWIAPEFINGLVEKLDKSADIYSFAMLMVKVLTGNDPFHNRPSPITGRDILDGERPNIKDYGVPVPLQQLMERCWTVEPKSRPDIEEVSKVLNELATAL